ncbi:Nucleolar protein 13 [Coniothyrium glycines]
MATFEDSGKCKGFAWVTFGDVDAATSAVKGFIWKNESDFKGKKKNESGSDEDDGAKKDKKRKWLLNKLAGRDLRCEFAEDSTTRYNKRYGKEKPEQHHEAVDGVNPARWKNFGKGKDDRGGRTDKREKVDPRTIKSGAAHSSAQRASQAIVESQGRKTTFD